MEPVRVSPLEGMMSMLKGMERALAGESARDGALTTNLPDITIDTCLPLDTDIWETGIERTKIEGKWVIVEQYPDEEAAKVGHQKWISILTEHPDFPLKDIDQWSLGI